MEKIEFKIGAIGFCPGLGILNLYKYTSEGEEEEWFNVIPHEITLDGKSITAIELLTSLFKEHDYKKYKGYLEYYATVYPNQKLYGMINKLDVITVVKEE